VGHLILGLSIAFLFKISELNRFECQHDEEITAVKSLDQSGIHPSAAFCVGIVRAQVGEHEPSLGRLVLFGVEGPERDLVLIASQETDGCVYAIDAVNGLIAVAVNTSVCIFCLPQGIKLIRYLGRFVLHSSRRRVNFAVARCSMESQLFCDEHSG
jgi:hypothetical protein